MALFLCYECTNCGRMYVLYVPYRLQSIETEANPEMIREAEELDKEDIKAGNRERVRKLAEHINEEFDLEAKFIDTTINEIVQCECGEVFDLLAFYANGGVIPDKIGGT